MLQKSLQVLGFLILSCGFAFSQGSITGTVTDAATGEAIVGANVVIQGSQLGAPTDVDGKFSIKNVAAGTYSLQVTFITYKPHVLNDVVVENGKRVNIDVKLSEEVSELQEVVVSGVRTIDNDFSLISAIREGKLVVTGVSAEMISRSPDRDAAEVVKRVPGVTIMGGRFVVIRGLSERYNVSMLHGAYAPSMEADRRSFAFDIIPSGQIDQLLVFKSPSPELPGDFAGGVVKITTKSIPDANTLSVSYSIGYRNGTSFDDFSQSSRTGSQFLGFNSGTNDLPSDFPTTSQLKGWDLNDPRRARAGRALPNAWVPEQTTAFLDQSVAITGGVKFNAGKVRIGNITSLNLSHSRTHFQVNRRDFDVYDFTADAPDPRYDYVDDQNNLNVRTGILHNWAFKFDDNNSIEFKNLFNQINNSQYIYRAGLNYENNNSGDPRGFGGFSETYRGVYSGQLVGKHKLFDAKTNINWVLNAGISHRDLPDMRRYRVDIDPMSGAERTFVPNGAAQTYFLGRFYSEMKEKNYSGSVGIDHTLEITDSFLPVVSAGVFYEIKDRTFDARNLGYIQGTTWDPSNSNLSIDELFEPQNINGQDGLQFDEQTNLSDSYDAQNNLLAYYGSVSLPFNDVKVSGGVRIESNTQSLQSFQTNGAAIDQEVKVNRVLPSMNASYNFSEKMLVRATYGQTLNRPEFREIAPFGFYDFEYNWVVTGNPDLKTARVNNYDVRWEWYPSKTEMVTFGGFYKDFTNAIEMHYKVGSGSISTFDFQNAGNAFNYGVELDVRKSLLGLTGSKFVDNINLLFNAALIKSEVQVDNQPKRELMGQSPYVINAGVYYNSEASGLQVSLLYNVAGRRLFAVGGYTDSGVLSYDNIYEMPRNVLDFSVSKTLKEKFQVKLSVADILNQKYVLLQDGNSDGEFNSTKDQIIQSNRYGSLFTLGLSYKVW